MGTGGVVGWTFLTLVLLACGAGVISYIGSGRHRTAWAEGPGGLVLLTMFLFFAMWSTVSAVKGAVTRKVLPFSPGRYLFATDLVIAESEELTLVPMARMKHFDGVHQHYNGAYTHTALNFTFEGWGTATFTVHGKQFAEEILNNLQYMTKSLSDAAKARDMKRLRELDVFHDAFVTGDMDRPGALGLASLTAEQGHTGGPLAREVPKMFKFGWALALLAGLIAATPAWVLAGRAADNTRLADALRYPSTYSFEAYMTEGGAFADDVQREYAPMFVFREALRRNSVQSLREFIEHNGSSRYAADARAMIQQTFVRLRQRFDQQAASDPQMVAFMTALLTYQEQHASPPLKVRFNRPSTDALEQIDARLAVDGRRLNHRELVRIAPHFTAQSSAPREQAITAALRRGFGAVFPNDVLSLQDGERIDGNSPATVTEPTIEVAYAVQPSGTFYTLRSGNRAFVGISVEFNVRMRVPGSSQDFTFVMTVEPPERFSFSYERPRYGAGTGPTDGYVYSVMAERAFSQLEGRMASVFFRPGTEGFRSLSGGTTAGAQAPTPPPTANDSGSDGREE